MRFVVFLTALFSIPSLSSAYVADLAGDWSDTNNPNSNASGTWSYNAGTAQLSAIASWTGIPGVNGWGPAANVSGDFIPFMFKANSADISDLGGLDIAVGDVAVHTWDGENGDGNGLANITWQAAAAGTATISGQLWPLRDVGRANNYTLIVDPTGLDQVIAAGSIPEDGSVNSANPITFSIPNVSLNSGEVVELLLTATTLGDFTGVNLNVNVNVPEPTCLALLSIAGLAVLARRPNPQSNPHGGFNSPSP
jgi:hypothetical protein